MTWIRLDDGMLDHPKWILALQLGGDGTIHLWIRLTAWSARHLTDGLIPAHVASSIPWPRGNATRAKAWQALADAQLIERQSNGDWLLHDYLDYQPSRAKTLADRGRKANNEQSRRDAARVARHDLAAPPERARSRPVPSRPVPIGDASASPRARVPTPTPDSQPPTPTPTRERPPDSSPEHTEVRAIQRGPLPPSRREQRREAEAARLGTTPAFKHQFDPEWEPSEDHRARGHELGLSDAQILEEAEDCRRKTYHQPFANEDDQFFRELTWLAKDLEKQRFKDRHERDRFENPGRDRAAR